MLKTISWELAFKDLRAILPSSAYFTPDSILRAADEIGALVQRKKMAESEQDDLFILRELLAHAKPAHSLVLVTDICFRAGGEPFILLYADIEDFAKQYRQSTGEVVVSGGDLVIVCNGSRFVSFWHHEGYAATIKSTTGTRQSISR